MTEISGRCKCYNTKWIVKTYLNGFLDGDLWTMVGPVVADNAVESMDLTNRDWRARFFIFILCIFITSSGRFHFGGVQPLSNSNMPNTKRQYYKTKYIKRRVQQKLHNGQLQLYVLIKSLSFVVFSLYTIIYSRKSFLKT